MKRNPLFLVLSAPSGAGKSTLITLLREEFPFFGYSVSCTTRAPRGHEQDGVAYHFLTEEEFLRRVEAGDFLEHAMVHGHRYGTLKAVVREMLDAGTPVLLDIDVAGAAQVREAVLREPADSPLRRGFADVFIDVPSLEELERRLVKRGEDSAETIAVRLRNAEGERARAGEYSTRIVNDDLDAAYARLRAVALAKLETNGKGRPWDPR